MVSTFKSSGDTLDSGKNLYLPLNLWLRPVAWFPPEKTLFVFQKKLWQSSLVPNTIVSKESHEVNRWREKFNFNREIVFEQFFFKIGPVNFSLLFVKSN